MTLEPYQMALLGLYGLCGVFTLLWTKFDSHDLRRYPHVVFGIFLLWPLVVSMYLVISARDPYQEHPWKKR